jgi:PTS system nitrogen regulatory IIA component
LNAAFPHNAIGAPDLIGGPSLTGVPGLIGDLISPGAMALGVTAADKRQALAVTAEIAARHFNLKVTPLFDALMEREAISATGVGHGVAIPHAQMPGLDRVRGVFVRLRPPIEFGAIDDEPVDLVFALISPPECGSDHLRALARVARSLRSSELRERLRQASTPDSVRALLTLDARPNAA